MRLARPSSALLSLVLALTHALGCDGAAPPLDATVAPDGGASTVLAPSAPAPLRLACPEGWRARPVLDERELGEVCDPWPESGRAACDGAAAHFPGEPGCRALGGDCAALAWPAELPATGVLYVEPGGAGDGSRAAPFGTVAQATTAARSGDTIALSPGTHEGPAVLPPGVSLVGACPATTTLRVTTAGTEGAVRIASGTALVRSLRITGPQPGIVATGAAAVDVRDVLIETAQGSGMFVVRGARLDARDLIVRDTQPDAGGRFGMGIDVELGGRATVERAAIEGSHQAGVLVFDAGSTFTGRSMVIVDTRPRPFDARGGAGVRAAETGSATLEASVLERNTRVSVLADEGHVALLDTVVRDTVEARAPGELEAAAWGLAVQLEGSAALTRVWLDASSDVGVYVSDGSLVGEDVAITRTRGRADGNGGQALFAQGSGSVELTRLTVAESVEAAVGLFDAESRVTLRDARIVRTRPRADGVGGRAVALEGGALLLERAMLEEHADMAVAARAGAQATLRDTRIRRVSATGSGRGYGVLVAQGSSATLERVLIEESTSVGLVVGSDSQVHVTDLSVQSTRSSAFGTEGRGVHVQSGGVLDGARVEVVENRELGLVAALGGRITLSDVVVAGTRRRACADDGTCPSAEAGFGVAVYPDSSVALSDFVLRDNAIAGVVVAGGTITLERGRIRGHPVGVSVQDDRDPASVLGQGVRLEDNLLDLDATTLPLPPAGLDDP